MNATKPTIFHNFPEPLARLAPFGPYRAVVDQLGDGDTFSVWFDAGLKQYPYAPLRLKGVWSPDGTGLDEDTRSLIQELAPPGTPVVIHTEKGPRSGEEVKSFERFVARVTLPDLRSLNGVLTEYLRSRGR